MDPLTLFGIISAVTSTAASVNSMTKKPGQSGHTPAGFGSNKIERIPEGGESGAGDPMQLQFRKVS